ncbi:MAG: 50S ribosomal protein L23 [Elusimicrobia bacterium]|jgi:large subunit ribosomal protein L23|nr:50S ribosomal protein L23 [Elusimicrobiota bacterium]
MSLSFAHILRRPLVTERSTQLKTQNKFVFEVAVDATKGQIREVVESAFKVDVVNVNTMRVPGKLRRRGQRMGYQSEWKKAIVTLKQGQDIKYAEPQG